jgi:hypothetical protein
VHSVDLGEQRDGRYKNGIVSATSEHKDSWSYVQQDVIGKYM